MGTDRWHADRCRLHGTDPLSLLLPLLLARRRAHPPAAAGVAGVRARRGHRAGRRGPGDARRRRRVSRQAPRLVGKDGNVVPRTQDDQLSLLVVGVALGVDDEQVDRLGVRLDPLNHLHVVLVVDVDAVHLDYSISLPGWRKKRGMTTVVQQWTKNKKKNNVYSETSLKRTTLTS